MKVGDLVKYMSRTLLIVDVDGESGWFEYIELGESTVGRYRQSALEVINESK